VAHVKLKDKLTPKEGEDVSRKVKASIEKTSHVIKRVRHACMSSIAAYFITAVIIQHPEQFES
jgi:hypothetical protein